MNKMLKNRFKSAFFKSAIVGVVLYSAIYLNNRGCYWAKDIFSARNDSKYIEIIQERNALNAMAEKLYTSQVKKLENDWLRIGDTLTDYQSKYAIHYDHVSDSAKKSLDSLVSHYRIRLNATKSMLDSVKNTLPGYNQINKKLKENLEKEADYFN